MNRSTRATARGTLGFVLASILLSTGCTMVGPQYKAPTATVKPEWTDLDDPQLSREPVIDPQWWSSASTAASPMPSYPLTTFSHANTT